MTGRAAGTATTGSDADRAEPSASSPRPGIARRALAAALAGDLDLGLRLADSLLSAESADDRAAGAAVAAAALAHRGQLERSAELSRWAGTPASVAFATVGFLATGTPDHPDPPPSEGPPTLLTGAAGLLARGVRESLTDSPTSALAALVQAASLLEPAAQGVLLPDSPAALAALAAIHSGELDLGASVVDRAAAVGMGGPLMARRHHLLQAWIVMLRGARTLAAPAAEPSADPGGPPVRLEPRDLLFAAALELGVARRNSDLAGLRRGWPIAREALLRHPVDLFTLLPLGELAMAAARLGELSRLQPHLQDAYALLDRLGNPPLWAAMLHWCGVHAAILAEQPAVAAEHVATLQGLAPRLRFAEVLTAAAQAWVDVLSGEVVPERVEAAARGLHGAGLAGDAARLAGQAAIRTPDRRAMTRLLEIARVFKGRSIPRAPAAASTGAAPPADGTASRPVLAGRLSAREHEVAALLLEGLTYKQIGDRLFISAKTVEHHVARMRQRLGCPNRRELLAQLRAMATDPAGE